MCSNYIWLLRRDGKLQADNIPLGQANPKVQSSTDLATSYAALILADDGIEITVRNIGALLEQDVLLTLSTGR